MTKTDVDVLVYAMLKKECSSVTFATCLYGQKCLTFLAPVSVPSVNAEAV